MAQQDRPVEAAAASGGCADKARRWRAAPIASIQKDLRILDEAYSNERLRHPILYFLEWVDHNLRGKHEDDTVTYQQGKSLLAEWCNGEPNRRAFVISRDNVGFAYPEGSWLVNPLPAGTTEEA